MTRTLEDVLSEMMGYEVDPVKMHMERQRRTADAQDDHKPAPLKALPERNNRSGPCD